MTVSPMARHGVLTEPLAEARSNAVGERAPAGAVESIAPRDTPAGAPPGTQTQDTTLGVMTLCERVCWVSPELKLKITAWVSCVRGCAGFEFRGRAQGRRVLSVAPRS